MGIIYLIENKLNGKKYIGQTIRTLEKRWDEHCKTSNGCTALNNAIKKYSQENFSVSVLIESENEKLDDLEVEYISKYNTLYPNGYNIQTGGTKGKKHCEESRLRMSESKKGNKNPNFGKSRNENTKLKISEAKSGGKHHFYGKQLTQEHKEKLSQKKSNELPMYLNYIPAREKCYQAEGYVVSNHPNGKNKYFTSKKKTLEEKYQLALDYLNSLNLQDTNAVQRLDGSG